MWRFEEYKSFLEKAGIDLQDCGVKGFGLPAQLAITAIENLTGSEFVVVGGDVFLNVGQRPELTHDSWHAPNRSPVSKGCFQRVSHESAIEYIENYRRRNGERFLYQLVLANL